MKSHTYTTAAASLCLVASAHAGSATMGYETDMFDLDTGATYHDCYHELCLPGDFRFGYNGEDANPVRIFQNQLTATIVFLDGTDFDAVGCNELEAAEFGHAFVDQPFDYDDTALIQTSEGNIYKVGHAVDNGDLTATFSFALLVCGPCPWDLDGDGEVGVLDLIAVITAWGETDHPSDVNGDGVVGVADLVDVISNWGVCQAS